jgi:hypothetical protein
MPTVVINEIAWMGGPESAQDEWLELYNAGSIGIDLSGWRLVAVDGSPRINLRGTIPPWGFYLLERTNDQSAPAVLADQIFSGALENSGEFLQFFNSQGEVVDEIDARGGWPAGKNDTKQTLSRKNTTWMNSLNPGGTPKSQNDFSSPQTIANSPAEVIGDPIESSPLTAALSNSFPSQTAPTMTLALFLAISAAIFIFFLERLLLSKTKKQLE